MSVASSNGSLRVGDMVNVPGNMYGTVKFIGSVDGKKGTFAGVQLAPEYASRGKNSGDVDGKNYFITSAPGSGIFLPLEKAEKRSSTGSTTSSVKSSGLRMSSAASPTTPGGLSNFNQGGRTPGATGLQKPNFSQSIGPGSLQARTSSPTSLKPPNKRESLPRPTSPQRQRPSSPLRKVTNAPAVQTPAAGRLQTPKTRPSLGLAKSTIGTTPNSMKSPGIRPPSITNSTTRFSQSLRQSTSYTPGRIKAPGALAASESSPLGPDDRFDEDDTILEGNETDTTPTPAAGRNVDRTSRAETEKYEQETKRLKEQLEERDQQLQGQATSIAEMESSLAELQRMIPMAMDENGGLRGASSIPEDEEELPRDVQSLRAALRERNDRMKTLVAEFDSNRADFRSTIDALEMASTETVRVYEARVEDLLEQIRTLQERNDDVEGVSLQFRQLEELVQELEEGLEESRRAEAEARSEVEFLRGEVERGKSELRREKERHAAQEALEGNGNGASNINEEYEEMQANLVQKDDEIRGLKAIIQSLQAAADGSPAREYSRESRINGHGWGHSKQASSDSIGEEADPALRQQIRDLEALLDRKNSREEELQTEVRKLRESVNLGNWSLPEGGFNKEGTQTHRRTDSETEKHASGGSQRTIKGQQSWEGHGRQDSDMPDMEDLNGSGPGSPTRDTFVDASDGSEHQTEERRRREAETQLHQSPSISDHTDNSSGQWCEICEESGHDILNCANMIGSSKKPDNNSYSDSTHKDDVQRRSNEAGRLHDSRNNVDRPAPLRKSSTHSSIASPLPLDPPPPPPTGPLPTPPTSHFPPRVSSFTPSAAKPKLVEGTGDQAGMVGGKTSGVIDPDKWCALCEKDGHDSVDCPIEDAF